MFTKVFKAAITKYYLPVVFVFMVVSFFDPGYRTDRPLETQPVVRLCYAFFESATLTSSNFDRSWNEFRQTVSGIGENKSTFELVKSLLGYSGLGFFLLNVLQLPLYAFAWVSQEKFYWIQRYASLRWLNPRFRHIHALAGLAMLCVVFVVAARALPLVVAVFLGLGAITALTCPFILLIPFGLIEIYKMRPPPWLLNLFDKFGLNHQIQPVPSPKQSASPSPVTSSSGLPHTTSNVKAKPKHNKQKSTWWEYINRN